MKTSIRVRGHGNVDVAENLVDKAIRYFNPVKGQQRFRSRVQMAVAGAYTGASKTRRGLSQWKTGGGSADSDIISDLPELRERSRDLVRNAPLAGGAINTVVTTVVGGGITGHPAIDRVALGMGDDEADALEAVIEREWKLWSESRECDVTRTQNFYGLQDLVFRSALENGDVFSLLPMFNRGKFPYQLKVQLIEADRISNRDRAIDTATLSGGVHLDSTGASTAVDIMTTHPGDQYRSGYSAKWETYPVFGEQSGERNVLHCYKQLRIGQTRGVPYLASVIEPLKQLDRYTEAEIMAAVVSGMFTVFIETETGETLDLSATAGETGAASTDDDMKLGNGAIIGLGENEKVTSHNPGRPNTAYDPFVMSILRQIGVQLELPFEVLIKHFTASYSASRAALLEAWKFFIARRLWLVDCFCDPVYDKWFAEAVTLGRINAPGFFADPAIRKAYTGIRWVGPGKGQLNESVEMDAIEKKLALGITTFSQATAEVNGGDWERNQRQLTREMKLKAASAPEPESGPDDQAP